MSLFAFISLIKFIVFSILIVYTYCGYNACLYCMTLFAKKRRRTIQEDQTEFPNVSFIIAAYNEENVIKAKIENILNLNYPKSNMKLYIVSDASSDRTHEIVNSYANTRVKLIVSPVRRGKTHCENLALKEIDDDYVVFTDASTMLEANCLSLLLQHFVYKEVGCVSTRDKSVDSDSNKGENLYVRYEMSIRSMESRVDSLVGLSGSCYVARRSLCPELPVHLTRDFALPLIARENGYISIDEPEAICYVNPTKDQKAEFKRKVRTFTNGLSTLFYKKGLLNIFKYGRFSFMLWSHKVFRWLLPVFFIGVFFANMVLFSVRTCFKITLGIQLVGYAVAGYGLVAKSNNAVSKIARIIFFVCMTNVASLMAWYSFFRGEKYATWDPTQRELE